MAFYVKNNKKSLFNNLKNSKKKIKNHRTRIRYVCYNNVTRVINVLSFCSFGFVEALFLGKKRQKANGRISISKKEMQTPPLAGIVRYHPACEVE